MVGFKNYYVRIVMNILRVIRLRERIGNNIELVDNFFSRIQNIDDMNIIGLNKNANKEIALTQIFERTNKIIIAVIFFSFLTLQILWVF